MTPSLSPSKQKYDHVIIGSVKFGLNIFHMPNQARSKQCLIGPAITKLSAGDLGAGKSIQRGSGHISGIQMHFKQNIVGPTTY